MASLGRCHEGVNLKLFGRLSKAACQSWKKIQATAKTSSLFSPPPAFGQTERPGSPPAFHTCASYFVSLELKLIIIEAASARVVLPPGGKFFPYGLYRPQGPGSAQLYVSRGIGMSGVPFRFLAPPELVVLG